MGEGAGRKMSELMDLRELAAYLRLGRQTLYNWLHQRKLSGIKMGGVWRFNRQAIDRWLAEQTILAAPPSRTPRSATRRSTSPDAPPGQTVSPRSAVRSMERPR